MADVNATRAALLAVLKEVYGDKIAEQVNRTTFIYNQFEKSKTKFGGKYWTVPLLDEGGQSVGSYNEDEEVADAQVETTKEIQIKPRQHYATIRISGLAMAASKQSLYSFVQAKDFEVRNKTRWLTSMLNANFYQDGKGVLGVVASASDSPDRIVMAAGTNMNWFRKGMKVDVWTADLTTTKRNGATTTKKQGWQITSTDKDNLYLNLGNVNPSTAGVVATDKVTYEDAVLGGTYAPADATGKYITGLKALVDDTSEGATTIQNIDRSVYTIFKAVRTHNGGTTWDLALDLLQKHIDRIEVESGETPDFMISGFGQRRNYLNLLWYDVRYGPKKLTGGFETLKYNNLDWLVDKDCEGGRIYVGLKENLKIYEVGPIGILDQAGPQMERVPHFDVHEILVGGYFNLGILQPNSWGKLVDLREP
jgi:hypothetical protein